jgi:hypothetical protein
VYHRDVGMQDWCTNILCIVISFVDVQVYRHTSCKDTFFFRPVTKCSVKQSLRASHMALLIHWQVQSTERRQGPFGPLPANRFFVCRSKPPIYMVV